MAKWIGIGGEVLSHKCGHNGCCKPAGNSGLCGRHKKTYGLPGAPVNQIKAAQDKKDRAEARRQKRGA